MEAILRLVWTRLHYVGYSLLNNGSLEKLFGKRKSTLNYYAISLLLK